MLKILTQITAYRPIKISAPTTNSSGIMVVPFFLTAMSCTFGSGVGAVSVTLAVVGGCMSVVGVEGDESAGAVGSDDIGVVVIGSTGVIVGVVGIVGATGVGDDGVSRPAITGGVVLRAG